MMGHCYAIFSVRFDPLVGGVESYTLNLARELKQQGDDVIVITKRITNSPEIETRQDGIVVVRLPTVSLINNRLPLSFRNRRHHDLLKHVAGMNVDRVLVNNRFYPHSIDGLIFAKSLNLPAIMLDHGSAYLTLGKPIIDWLIKCYEHIMTMRAKRFRPLFCGVSAKSTEWLKTFGIQTEYVIPNSIDADSFRNEASARDFRTELNVNENDVLVAFVGRLTPEKGCDVLVRVANSFENDQIVFVLAGDGTMRDELTTKAGKNVHFLGIINHSDLSALMRDADVFCLPTRSEGFCTSLLEASAWATPSIITDVGGVQEVIGDQSCGIIIQDMTDASVQDGLKQLLGLKPTQRRELGMRSYARVTKHCTWHESVLALQRAFEQAENNLRERQ